MRPSVEEQLLGTCRILETVVAPSVSEPFARTILDNLIANLRMVTEALPAVSGFLHWDNAATRALLQTLRSALPPELAARIDARLAASGSEADDSSEQTKHNDLLRALLAEAVCSPDLTGDLHRAIQCHMITRASRAPMRYVPSAASAAPLDPRS